MGLMRLRGTAGPPDIAPRLNRTAAVEFVPLWSRAILEFSCWPGACAPKTGMLDWCKIVLRPRAYNAA